MDTQSRIRACQPAGAGPVRDRVRRLSAEGGCDFGGQAAGPAGVSPTVRETVEAIVRAVGAGDDPLIGHLLTRFTQIADFDALIHLRTRLYTTLGATKGARPNGTFRLRPAAIRFVGPATSGCSANRPALSGRRMVPTAGTVAPPPLALPPAPPAPSR